MASNQQKINQERLERVAVALEKVPAAITQEIIKMVNNMSDLEIIQSFNQQSLDLFTHLMEITGKLGKEGEFKVGGYKELFDNASKINVKLPIDKYTLVILEYAVEIYEEREDCFLNMTIPDKKVNLGNEFNIIRSEMFKQLWLLMNGNDRKTIKQDIILLTSFAHAYFFKSVLNQSGKSR